MFHVAANQMQLAVIMALIAKSRAQGQNDRPDQSEEGPLKVIVIGYTLLVIFVTLFLRQFIAWLCTPQVSGGDHAAGMPQPPLVQGPPGSTSFEPSQGSSITVDWQGREVNRPSARAKGKRKGKGQGKGEGQPEDFDWAYGPARPMTPEERSQFGLQNREWLLRWFASLSPEERTQAGLDQPLLNSGSSNPTSQSDSTLAGIQEEPEQEVPAGDPIVPVQQASPAEPEVREEETLHHPSERDYRDIMMDEAWEPTPDPPRHGPPQPAPKAGPKGFRGKGDPPSGDGRRFDGMGVFITRFGQKYHAYSTCPTLSSSVLRESPPCHQYGFQEDMARIRRGETIWSKGWGDPYHANSARPPSCATGSEKKYDPCIHCLQELRARGWNL